MPASRRPGRGRATAPALLLVLAGTLAPAAGTLLLTTPRAVAEEDVAPRLARARAAAEAGDHARAQREYEAAVGIAPANADAHEGLIRAWLALRDPKKAAVAAKVARLSCPNGPGALRAASAALLANGEFPAAEEAADASLAAPGGSVAAGWRAKAEAAAKAASDRTAGEKILRGALKSAVDRADVLMELGDYLADGGAPEPAAAALRDAVGLAPRNVRILARLTEVLLTLGNVKEARETALRAVDAGPEDPLAHVSLGRTFEAEKDYRTALGSYETAASLQPRNAEYQTSVGYAYLRVGRNKEAEAALRAAVKLAPDTVEARLHLGWLLNASSRAKDALEEYQAVLKRVPDHPRALWYAADISVVLGKAKDAEALVQRLLAIQPAHSEAHRLLADVAFQSGKLEAAKEAVRKALDADPKNSRALLTRGRIEEEEQNFEDAEKTYRQGLEANPDDLWIHLYLAELCDEVLDKPDDALTHFKRYLALGGTDRDEVVARKVKELENP